MTTWIAFDSKYDIILTIDSISQQLNSFVLTWKLLVGYLHVGLAASPLRQWASETFSGGNN